MKRYAFPLTIILLLFAVIALAAPGDKRPAVTSAAIGLGSSSSPTLASITATTSVTAPAYNSTAADGYHYVRPYNSIAFAGTPSIGMLQTTPTGPQWYTGSAWEAIGSGGASAISDLTDWPSGLTATELGYLDGATSNIQAQINAISVGSPITTAPTYSDQTCTAGQYAFDASYAYFCRTSNTWDRIALAGWSNPAPVAPTFSGAALSTDGTTLTLGMSASTSVGAGGSGGIVATGSTSGALSGTYSSGAPGTSLVYTLPSSIKSGETVTLAYTQPGNGLEGATGGADVVTVSGVSVTNNSTQTGGYSLYWDAQTTSVNSPDISATAGGSASLVATSSGDPTYPGNMISVASRGDGYYSIPITAGDVFSTSTGGIKFYYRCPNIGAENSLFVAMGLTSGNLYGNILGNGSIKLTYGAQSLYFGADSGQFNLASNTWYLIEMGWEKSTNRAFIKVNSTRRDVTLTDTITGTPSSLRVGGGNYESYGDMDQIYTYTTYK